MKKSPLLKLIYVYLLFLVIFITPKVTRFFSYNEVSESEKSNGFFSTIVEKIQNISFPKFKSKIPGVRLDGRTFNIEKATFTISPYYITDTEITVSGYVSLMGKNPTKYDDNSFYPVVNVTWLDAIKYCNALSEYYKLKPVYTIDENNNVTADFSKNGWRLPTKLEWYNAAASGGLNDNESLDSSVDYIDKHGWYYYNSDHKAHEVATKEPNLSGIYDMRGNVSEWCWDYFWDWTTTEAKEYPKDYRGPDKGQTRSICGGFYDNSAKKLNVLTVQDMSVQNGSNVFYGFRVARNAK